MPLLCANSVLILKTASVQQRHFSADKQNIPAHLTLNDNGLPGTVEAGRCDTTSSCSIFGLHRSATLSHQRERCERRGRRWIDGWATGRRRRRRGWSRPATVVRRPRDWPACDRPRETKSRCSEIDDPAHAAACHSLHHTVLLCSIAASCWKMH